MARLAGLRWPRGLRDRWHLADEANSADLKHGLGKWRAGVYGRDPDGFIGAGMDARLARRGAARVAERRGRALAR